MFTSPQFRSCCFGGFLRILLLHQQCLKDKICPPRLLVKQAVATNIWFTDSPVKNRSRFHWSFHSTPHGVSHHPSIWLPQLLISELAEISGELIQQLIILIEVQNFPLANFCNVSQEITLQVTFNHRARKIYRSTCPIGKWVFYFPCPTFNSTSPLRKLERTERTSVLYPLSRKMCRGITCMS